jgi:hypothetical protein
MTKSHEVLYMLCKGVEYNFRGENYENIDWLGKEPAITKEQFEAGFAQFDAWKAEQDVAQAAQRQALLTRLGITEDEVRLLLG